MLSFRMMNRLKSFHKKNTPGSVIRVVGGEINIANPPSVFQRHGQGTMKTIHGRNTEFAKSFFLIDIRPSPSIIAACFKVPLILLDQRLNGKPVRKLQGRRCPRNGK